MFTPTRVCFAAEIIGEFVVVYTDFFETHPNKTARDLFEFLQILWSDL